MRNYFILFLIFFSYKHIQAQDIQQSAYGGIGSDIAVSISLIDNQSVMVFSTSSSFNNNSDYLLSKIANNGIVEWSKTYGGLDVETAVHMERTSDNGYILLGNTLSYGNGNEDIYVVKTDSIGNVLWSRTYGGAGSDFSGCIKEVLGKGYVIAGRTQSYGEGEDDGYLVRIDTNGIVLWSYSYGTNNSERFYYLDNTKDNGFIIAGIQKVFSNFDQLVIKIDSVGNIIFSKNLGDANGLGNDAGDCIKETFDGGYILCGQYRAFGSGGEDLALTKISSIGNVEWAKVFGNLGNDRAVDFAIDDKGNCILAGYTNSFGLGGFDGFMVKVDQSGFPLWYRTYGYNLDDYFSEIEIGESGYIASGYTNSFGSGTQDIFIVKTDFDGANDIECTNINVIDNFFSPTEISVNQMSSFGCVSNNVFTIANEVLINKVDFLPVLPALDSIYAKSESQIPLDVIPSIGVFKVDGVISNSFTPINIGNHLLEYKYEIAPGCAYNYKKEILVVNNCKYSINDVVVDCNNDFLCIPLKCNIDIGKGVVGLNYCLKYDSSVLVPTSQYALTDIVTHGKNNWATASITLGINQIQVSIYYTNNAPINTTFKGIGDLICLEFKLKNRNSVISGNLVSVCQLNELHKTFDFITCGDTGHIRKSNLMIRGGVNYKEDPLEFKRVFEKLSGSLSVGIVDDNYKVITNKQVGLFKEFRIDSSSYEKIILKANNIQLSSSHSLMQYRNGFDAFQMENIITNKVGTPMQIEPTPYVMIAADVDLNDKVRSNDISLLQERIVRKIDGFPQHLPVELNQDHLDWRFIDKKTVDNDQAFKKASNYPYYSSKGYSRDNVPDVPFYLSDQGSCDSSYVETYSAILLGDLVNGGSGINADNFVNQSSYVTLDLDDIHDLGYGTYRVFLNHALASYDKLKSLDFALDYDENDISISTVKMTVEDRMTNPQWMYNDYNSEEVLFTSYSMNGYPTNGSLVYADIRKPLGVPSVEDLGKLHVFLNGSEVPSTIRSRSQTITGIDFSKDVSDFINLFPNPTDGRITISLPEVYVKDLHIEFINAIGQSIVTFNQDQAASEIELDLSLLPSGLYNCLIQIQDKTPIIKKVVVR